MNKPKPKNPNPEINKEDQNPTSELSEIHTELRLIKEQLARFATVLETMTQPTEDPGTPWSDSLRRYTAGEDE